jgi:hypothetical protein
MFSPRLRHPFGPPLFSGRTTGLRLLAAALLAGLVAAGVTALMTGDQPSPAALAGLVTAGVLLVGFLAIGLSRAVAGILLLVTLPAFLITAARVRLAGPGPLFSRSRRIGDRGVEYDLLTFRTTADEPGPRTGDGAALRDAEPPAPVPSGREPQPSLLTELPKLFNVLRGDLSLAGSLGPRGGPGSEHRSDGR